MRLRGVLLMVTLLAGCAAACTLWIDDHFKGYSGTCQVPNAGANVCGQCGTQHCQPLIDRTCGQLVTDQLDQCFADPSYTTRSNWYCSNFFDDAAVYDPSQTPDESNLRHCVHDNCPGECTTCTDFDAGAPPCGDCLRANCASIMNGIDGCCGDDQIGQAMLACGSVVNHSCSAFLEYDAGDASPPDAASAYGYCMYTFSQCVQKSCAQECK